MPTGGTQWNTEVLMLRAGRCPLVVVWMQLADTVSLLRAAHQHNFFGRGHNRTDHVQWLFSESAGKLVPELAAFLSPSEVGALLKGALMTVPFNGIGTPGHTEVLRRWQQQPSTVRQPGQCLNTTDDSIRQPSSIFSVDHDSDAATPDECAGMNFASDQMDAYAPFAYDTVLAIAHALHDLLEVEGLRPCDYETRNGDMASVNMGLYTCFTPRGFYEALLKTSFVGVSGEVSFLPNGDRSLGPHGYSLRNHNGSTATGGTPAPFELTGYLGATLYDCADIEADGGHEHASGSGIACVPVTWPPGLTGFANAPKIAVKQQVCPLGWHFGGRRGICEPCAKGFMAPYQDLTHCIACTTGFANETGLIECYKCPATTRRAPGSPGTSIVDCECEAG